ncbi:signal transducing kinase of the PAK [Ceratobasidium sp. 370]|nr:signal transducing kinase of the PAK [Ceratobasidium sp. 370]
MPPPSPTFHPLRASTVTLDDEGEATTSFGPSSGGGTSTKRKNRLSLIDRFFGAQKRPDISTPFDTVHLTHVRFHSSTGEFTGLPLEWQQLLSDSGISRLEQERNPEAVMEIMKFYQETQGAATVGDVWDKMNPSASQNGSPSPERRPELPNKPGNGFQNPRPPPPPPKRIRSHRQQPRAPAVPGPSASRPAPSAPSPSAPPLSLSKSQRAPPSPLPQPEVARSRSQGDVPRASSATGPLTPGVSGPRAVRGHHVRMEVAPGPTVSSFAKHAGTEADATNRSASVSNAEITSLMTVSEVIARLGTRGCPDLGDQLDEASCTKYPISNGGYGDIYKAKLKNGTEVAIKTMRLLLDAEGQKHIKHAARELYTWSKCRHRNVQRLLGLVEFRDQIGMVSAWETNGDLNSYLQHYPETDRYQIAHGDLKGVGA